MRCTARTWRELSAANEHEHGVIASGRPFVLRANVPRHASAAANRSGWPALVSRQKSDGDPDIALLRLGFAMLKRLHAMRQSHVLGGPPQGRRAIPSRTPRAPRRRETSTRAEGAERALVAKQSLRRRRRARARARSLKRTSSRRHAALLSQAQLTTTSHSSSASSLDDDLAITLRMQVTAAAIAASMALGVLPV